MSGRSGKRGAHFLVEGVNLGDGRPVRCWFRITKAGVEVRRYRAHRAWLLPLADAAGVVARAAQLRVIGGRP